MKMCYRIEEREYVFIWYLAGSLDELEGQKEVEIVSYLL